MKAPAWRHRTDLGGGLLILPEKIAHAPAQRMSGRRETGPHCSRIPWMPWTPQVESQACEGHTSSRAARRAQSMVRINSVAFRISLILAHFPWQGTFQWPENQRRNPRKTRDGASVHARRDFLGVGTTTRWPTTADASPSRCGSSATTRQDQGHGVRAGKIGTGRKRQGAAALDSSSLRRR